ncbi:golgin subfamily A member 2 [Culicoides brevitarsis]|uniref:golgin subfamily A member 2 n=1 Tax=Culicoides brevitarsis TaxID=469753 RepID=UPI00307C03E4
MDKDKAEKIAQAKKKLKEFQSKRGEPTPAKPESESPEITKTEHSEAPPASQLSTLESLYQLSTRINSIVKDENIPANSETFVKDLEIRNQELVASLDGERLKNEELNLQVRDLNSTVDKLKIEIERLKVENETKLTMEMGPLQEQLQSHIQTIGLLVGEKSELKTYLKEYQNSVEAKRTENLELETRLRASRFRVSELEREIKTLKSSGNVTENSSPEANNSELLELRKQNDEFVEQVNELKQKITLKNDEIAKLGQKMEELTSQLNMANLRIEQLSSGDTLAADSRLESLTQQNLAKEMQITELKNMIQQLGTDRDQSNAQYQSYVLQLNREISNLGDKNLTLTEENDKLAKREAELMKHMGELERQIQQQMTKQKDVEEKSQVDAINSSKTAEFEAKIKELQEKLEKSEAEAAESKKQVEILSTDKVQLKIRLDEAKDQLSSLELTNERLQTDKPDAGKLIAEIENYKVAASRAMSQNSDLKNQLEEMQRVFVQLSNDKLELTEKLQAEQHLCREMRNTYSTIETDLAKTKEHLRLKDEEMIRLAHETTDLNKQILMKEQEIDRLRHYEASSDAGNLLQRELESAKEYIEKQKQRISELEANQGRVETPDESTSELSTIEEGRFAAENEELVHEVESLQQEKQVLLKEIAELKEKVQNSNENSTETQVPEVQSSSIVTPQAVKCVNGTETLPLQDALEKLQARFRQTMNEVAELSEEKQQLEHLVTQLQFETETIGEYITLYQNQRRQLKQKDLERDYQLRKLAVDRENMRQKLLELNSLIEQLLVEKKRKRNVSEDDHPAALTNGNSSLNASTTSEMSSPNTSLDETNKENVISSTTSTDLVTALKKTQTKETASKILALLSDIQTANQTSLDEQPGVDHCSCCSGKLEVV